jgi:hypothetical protein
MRLRIILLVVAASSLVLVSFLIPLALVLRSMAADRAVNSATVHARSLAPQVARLPVGDLHVAIAKANAHDKATQLTVFPPGVTAFGAAPQQSSGVPLARRGRSFNTAIPGGVEVLVAVQRPPGGTAVIRTFVPDSQLRGGVARTWLLLGVACARSRALPRPRTAWPPGTCRPGPSWPGRPRCAAPARA